MINEGHGEVAERDKERERERERKRERCGGAILQKNGSHHHLRQGLGHAAFQRAVWLCGQSSRRPLSLRCWPISPAVPQAKSWGARSRRLLTS